MCEPRLQDEHPKGAVTLACRRKSRYDLNMKYEVELPDDIDRRLCKKASASGDDVARLICIAVGRFVWDDVPTANGAWSEESETRRRALIDMDIAEIGRASCRERV